MLKPTSKIDVKKQLAELYAPSAKDVVRLNVPPLTYLMIDGHGDPANSPSYAEAVQALFKAAYTAKFMLKKGPQQIDYAVMPLEGLWWADDLTAFVANDRAKWQWTMMIMQPEVLDRATLDAALHAAAKTVPAVAGLRIERFDEGLCAQTLHVGPFTEEGPTIQRVHAFIEQDGALRGKHHEIYLSDIRRADPRRWKTIIRQPMQALA